MGILSGGGTAPSFAKQLPCRTQASCTHATDSNAYRASLNAHSTELDPAQGTDSLNVYRPTFKRVLYTALTPTINMLSVAGLISIPGMMTGQILAGGDAIVAAKYQVHCPKATELVTANSRDVMR